MLVKQKRRQPSGANGTLLFLVAKERVLILFEFGLCEFGGLFGRKEHRMGSIAQLEMKLELALEEVAAAVGTLFVLYLRVHIQRRGDTCSLLPLHVQFYFITCANIYPSLTITEITKICSHFFGDIKNTNVGGWQSE